MFRSPINKVLRRGFATMENYIKKVEINCDMGEGFGKWKMGPDEELLKVVDVANVACGFHAGDPTLMMKTVRMAKARGVKIGAHPGLQDLFGFGRRRMQIDPNDMYAMILYQVGALKAFLDAEGVPLNHIKPHGELFAYMQRDMPIMRAVLEASETFGVPVYGAKNAHEEKAMCEELGITYIEEAYVDIDWNSEGRLLTVGESKMKTVDDIYERASSIGLDDSTWDLDGKKITLGFEGQPFSFCIHSDMPTALDNAKACRRAVDEINQKKGFPAA